MWRDRNPDLGEHEVSMRGSARPAFTERGIGQSLDAERIYDRPLGIENNLIGVNHRVFAGYFDGGIGCDLRFGRAARGYGCGFRFFPVYPAVGWELLGQGGLPLCDLFFNGHPLCRYLRLDYGEIGLL